MGSTTVIPETFTLVEFDHATILALVETARGEVGLEPSVDLTVEVDERVPLIRSELRSLDPVHVYIEGGLLEDPKRNRQFNTEGAPSVLGHILFRVRDRLDPEFGDPPPEGELELKHRATWDCYNAGRLSRLGHRAQRQRRIYQFRNRHGFTDAADAAFEKLWTAESLTWQDLQDISDGV